MVALALVLVLAVEEGDVAAVTDEEAVMAVEDDADEDDVCLGLVGEEFWFWLCFWLPFSFWCDFDLDLGESGEEGADVVGTGF